MDFARIDQRGYPTTDVVSGYAEWAATYDRTVVDALDLRLLERLNVDWAGAERVADLACGGGRIGAWMRARGTRRIDGCDLTPQMLERASARGVYDALEVGDVREPPLPQGVYDVVVASLVDEHLPDLSPLYTAAAGLLHPGGAFVIVGLHPQFFLTTGMPTHFHRADGEAVAFETHVHRLSEHAQAALTLGLRLEGFREGVVDDELLRAKPKWESRRGLPVSYAFLWRRGDATARPLVRGAHAPR